MLTTCSLSDSISNLFTQALEHYEDIADIKRAIVHTSSLPIDVSWHHLSGLRNADVPVVAHQLLQSPYNGTVDGLSPGDVAGQYPPELASCYPDCNEVFGYPWACQAH